MVNLDMSKYSIVTLDEVESTNAYALENMTFLEDSTVIYTAHQTLGRGRYSRKWIGDGSDNIYMSFVLKIFGTNDFPFPNLTQYLSVVVCDFLEKEFKINSEIKWPNDILVNGCKISGILAESVMKNNKIEGIALGLGLNVNLKKETLDKIDQKAISLSVLFDKYFDTDILVRKISDMFFENYNNFVKYGFSFIKNKYISKCGFLGKNIQIRESNQKKNYFAKAIDDGGLLLAIDENNNVCKIITGDVLC